MTTHLGILRLRLALPADTLKEKRSIVKGVVERLRTRFNAAVAEVDDLDTPAYTTIAVACLGNEAPHVDRQLQTIAKTVEQWRLDAELLEVNTELIPLG